ncbi:TetR/AcrR family transcriptional regulator [Rhodococcus opacus]|uniref:TetR/AcrR family transcriptional regulator n=1 Tax=Rhodococcus opacus TaxID=37919 RepID=UPI001F194115|nr:TetR/AcrR family transcriptional regulator [Rhodococcus opacus]
MFTRNVAQFGYDGTNFSEIARELSISKGTIVHHYGTKDRLLAALHESYMRRRLAEASSILDRLDTPTEQLAALLYTFVLYQEYDRDATVAFQRETMRLPALEADGDGIPLRTEYLSLVRDVVDRGIAAGQFRKVDVRLQSLLMFGSAQWAHTWFDPEGEEHAVEVGAELVNLVLGSLLTDRGGLKELSDPRGLVARTAIECLEALGAHSAALTA